MRIVVFSDIHGNYQALEAILQDIKIYGYDKIVCLGDIATLGPQPLEVIDSLLDLRCEFVLGNHDQALLEPEKAQQLQIAEPLISTIHWCLEKLDSNRLSLIKSFKKYLQLNISQHNNVIFYHGSPDSNTENIFPDTPIEKLTQFIDDFSSNIFIGGHTHIQMLRQEAGCYFINPGSTGCPFKCSKVDNIPEILPWAEYAIVNIKKNVTNIQLKRVFYDIEKYKSIIRKSNLPIKEWWLNQYS